MTFYDHCYVKLERKSLYLFLNFMYYNSPPPPSFSKKEKEEKKNVQSEDSFYI